MRWLRTLLVRVRGLVIGHQPDPALQEELESHLEMATTELIERGLSPEEARRQALIAAGGLTQAAESVRERRSLPWVEHLMADLRFGFRSLGRSPGFSAVVILTLALGIGATTAIFSVVRAVLLKPLPHRDGEHLVYLRHSTDGQGGQNINFSVPEIRELRAGAPAFEGVAEYSPWSATFQDQSDAVNLTIGLVTGNFFEVMGLKTDLGRITRATDDGPGVPPVMVLTHEFWIRRFGGDSGVIGRVLQLNGKSVEVIGVLQPAPYFPDPVDGFINMVFSPHHLSTQMVDERSHRMTEVIARLAPGATVDQARAQVMTINEREGRDFPAVYDPAAHYRISVTPFQEAIGDRARLTLWLLMGAAAFVLIISAANVTNLTLMRGVRRSHELLVRTALGAGVARLRRLLMVENLILTVLGAALGMVVAAGGLSLLVTFVARYSPRAGEVRLDRAVLGFTVLVAIAIALVLSWVAALPREGALGAWISTGLGRITGSGARQRLQRGLVVAQVAVSVMLLAGAGLLTRTTIQLAEVDTGLRTEEVLTIPVTLMDPTLVGDPAADAAIKQRYLQIAEAIRALPGVVQVGVASSMPLTPAFFSMDVKAEGKLLSEGQPVPRAGGRMANPEYFEAAGVPILKGRAFTDADRAGGLPVVILNQALADQLFPGEDPINKRVAWTGDLLRYTPFTGDWRTVVGVVGNTPDDGLDAAAPTSLYMPFAQELSFSGGIVVRADSNVSALVGAATRIVKEMAPGVAIDNVMTVAQIRERSVSPRRLNAMLISSFGLLALLIAAVGIGGVLAFSVSARTREIGIRMSLGADRGQVERMVLSEGAWLLAGGLGLGVAGALGAGRAIRGLLFGVTPYDPYTLVTVGLVMAGIGVFASWIPARRAARVDPVIAMRGE